jgi:hypothetical protein
MPPKRSRKFVTMPHPAQYGEGFFGDIGHWIKGAANTVYRKALKPVGNFVKDNHLISTGVGALVPGFGAKVAALGLRQAGLGRGRQAGSGKPRRNFAAIRV